MRIIVTSDCHKRPNNLLDIIERHIETTDLFINLGDSKFALDNALLLYPDLKIERVRGNCDSDAPFPASRTITVDGKLILFTHGHPYYVKHGYEIIEQKAKEIGADICLFGHTHIPYIAYKDNIHYMNPGAVRDGFYGIIDITPSGIMAYNQKI